MGTLHVVGISDCKTSSDPSDSVVTYGLGSCVGVVLYDARAAIGGMAHVMLPDSRWRRGARDSNPHMCADTAVPALLGAVTSLGAAREHLVAKLAGGANMLVRSALFDIGARNAGALLALLRRENIPVAGASLGGSVGRSMQFRLHDGLVRVQVLGRGTETL